MARTGLKKAKPSATPASTGGKSSANKKAQSSAAATQKAKPSRSSLQQQHKRHSTPVTSNLRSRGRAEGARNDIDQAFNDLRSGSGGAAGLNVRQDRPKPPKLGHSSSAVTASKQSQDQLLQTFESLMA